MSLPSLSDFYSLDDSQIEEYRQNGWVLLRQVCNKQEIPPWGEAITVATRNNNHESRPLEQRDTYGKAFLQTMNLWQTSPEIAPFTLAPRFAGIAAKLLGVDKVRVYHDQSLFKEPGGGHTPWHQDGFYWPIDQSKTVTMWMPLVDVPAEMGSMSFADGSHQDGILDLAHGISDNSEAYYQGFIDGKGYRVRTSGPMTAGDATFHSGITLHKAPGNPTDRVRAVMTIIYFADGLTVLSPKNVSQREDTETWFPGLSPGDAAASALNPIV